MHPGQTTGDETHAAFARRSIPAEPRRFAPLIVAFRSKYTRYSSLTRLVSRAPPRPRRSRGFHHRLFTAPLCGARRCVSVEIHPVFLPHAPCQPGASPLSALTRVPPQAATPRAGVGRLPARWQGTQTPGIQPGETRKGDRELGMERGISRRDFLNGIPLGVGALTLPGASGWLLGACTAPGPSGPYPPALTGLRGSHPGFLRGRS